MNASERFSDGMNCAQAVFLTHAPSFGIEPDMAMRLAAPQGGGIGGLERTCGALTAVCLLAGLQYGDYDPNDPEAKAQFYERIQRIEAAFAKEFGTSLCAELLADTDDRANRPCDRCVAVADRLAADLLFPSA
jgi:C_GCAxxG_C_C family probable redox protein